MNVWLTRAAGRCRRSVQLLCLAAVINVAFVAIAQAHKVNVFAYVEGDRVMVEGYFSGNVKAQNCQVLVFDSAGNKLIEGKTDTKGVYSFGLKDLPPFKGGLKIVLEAEMGHRAEYNLAESEIPARRNQGSQKPQGEGTHETKADDTVALAEKRPSPPPMTDKGAEPKMAAPPQPALNEEALQKSLSAMLDQKLAPIVKMLGNQERILLESKMAGPSLSEIVGGIGWILGIVGTAAFFWGKKRAR